MQCTCQTCVDPDQILISKNYIITAFIEIVEYEEIFHIFCRIFHRNQVGYVLLRSYLGIPVPHFSSSFSLIR